MSDQQSITDAAKAWEPSVKSGEDLPKVEYFKLKDGEEAEIRILNDVPLVAFVTYIPINGKRHPVTVLKEDNERVKADGHKIQKGISVNVLDRRDKRVKIWTFRDRQMGQVQAIMKKWKKLPTEFDLSITRRGVDLQTEYDITIAPNMEPLSEAEKTLALVDLVEYFKPNKERLDALLNGKTPDKKEVKEDEAETPNPLTDADDEAPI